MGHTDQHDRMAVRSPIVFLFRRPAADRYTGQIGPRRHDGVPFDALLPLGIRRTLPHLRRVLQCCDRHPACHGLDLCPRSHPWRLDDVPHRLHRSRHKRRYRLRLGATVRDVLHPGEPYYNKKLWATAELAPLGGRIKLGNSDYRADEYVACVRSTRYTC